MTIYNINFGIGWASSGVEYAQAYRAQLLRQLNYPIKFVFLDFIQSENIQTLTVILGSKMMKLSGYINTSQILISLPLHIQLMI